MEHLGVVEAARLLGVSVKTIYRYCRSGVLVAVREHRGVLGRYRLLIDKEAVERLLDQQRQGQPQD
jgi:excisionase family DNA binding protein